MRQKLKWISAARSGSSGSPAVPVAVSGQLTPVGIGVSVYGFRGCGICNFYNGDAVDEDELVSTCISGAYRTMDRDTLDGNGGYRDCPNGVYVDILSDAYDAAILVDESTREA